MTKLSPEAIAFRAKIDAEQADWPDDLKEAATFLRCELDRMLYKGWRESGGPASLAEYATKFARLYAEWQGRPPIGSAG